MEPWSSILDLEKKNSRASYILVLRSDRKQEKGEIVDD
jgi:hypothetical protein